MNEYTKQFPDVMKGKKIMYVHGFCSSAESGTVKRLREMLPGANTVAEDIPIDPHEAISMLRDMAQREQPDLIIGTSMGGMYAEQLHGFDRILVNPAFQIADTMAEHGMMGKQTFFNPRKDGVQEFIMTKALCKEYRAVQEQCFQLTGAEGEADGRRVYGLFGDQDPLVHTFPLFSRHYRQGISFHGEHFLNDRVFIDSVIPVVRWIDDLQQGRERPTVLIDIEALRDGRQQQRSSAMKAVRMLIESYRVFFVAASPNYDTDYLREVQRWTQEVVNVPAWGRLVFTNEPQMLLGDYFVGLHPSLREQTAATPCDAQGGMYTLLPLGSDTFKTWEEIIEYFALLGGQ